MISTIRLFAVYLALWLVCSTTARAQYTITSVPNPICAGSVITVTYQDNTNLLGTIAVYLYNTTSNDSIKVAEQTVLPRNSSLTVTIPSDRSTGSYRLRIINKILFPGLKPNPFSSAFTINALPPPPAVVNVSYCLGERAVPLLATSVNGGKLNWYDSDKSTQASSAITPSTANASQTTYYVSQTVNGCEGLRASVTVTVNARPPKPSVPNRLLSYCQTTQAAILTANAPGSLNWYSNRTSQTRLTNLLPSTSVVGQTTYYVSQTDSRGCESDRDSLTITINPKPVPPTVTVPPAYCQTTAAAPLSATALTGNSLKWYGTNKTGNASSNPTIPTTTTAGITPYYVSQIDAKGCESEQATITVTVNVKPNPPATTPISLCQNVLAVSLLSAVNATGTLTWYGNQTDNNALPVTPTYSTSVVGETTFYVSQTVNGCESDRSAVRVTIKALPDVPLVAPNPVVLCQSSVPIALSATATGELKWYDPAGVVSSSILPSTTTVGTTVYKVSQLVNGCEGLPASLSVIVIRKPELPAVVVPAPYCQLSKAVSLSATGQNLKWYANNTDKNPLAGAPTPSTDQVGTPAFYVSQTDANGCESDRASIQVQVKVKPAPPGTIPVSFCSNQVKALTATFSDNVVPNWYGTSYPGGPPTPTAPVPSTAIVGSPVNYYVSQTLNGCESDAVSIPVTIKAIPGAPAVNSTPVVYCQGKTAAPLSATATGELTWYQTPTGGTGLPNLSPQTLSSNPPTSYYYVSQSVNGCEGPRASIAVTINPRPAQPAVVSPIAYCLNDSTTQLSAIAPNPLNWYADSTGLPTIPAPKPLTTTPGSTIYYVSQTDINKCESYRTPIQVLVKARPAAPGVSPSTVELCLRSSPKVLTATFASDGSPNWYTRAGGVPSPAAIIPPTSATGTTAFYVSQTVNNCEGPKTTIIVNVKPLPEAPGVASTVDLCLGSPKALTATFASNASPNWYTRADGVPSPAAIIPPASATGTTAFYVSQTVNNCEGPKTTIIVNVKPLPMAPGVSASALTYCQGSSPGSLTAITNGGSLNWYGTNPGGPSSGVAPVPLTDNPGIFTYYVSQTVNGCEGPQAPIVVLIQATPDVPTVGPTPVYCQGGPVSALEATPSPGGILNWYKAEKGGPSSPTPPTPPVNAAGTVTYYVSQSIGTCESPRVSLTATIKAAPGLPGVTPSVTYCLNTTANALVATPSGTNSISWYDSPTVGNHLPTAYTPKTDKVGSFPYYASQTDANGCESNRALTTVVVNALPAVPATTPVTVCQNTVLPLLTLAVNATGTLNWYTDQTGGTPSPTAPSPSTLEAKTIPYYVSQTDANRCESNRSLLLVTIAPTPTPPAVAAIAPVCQGTTPFVLPVSGQNLKWYSDPVSPTSLGSSVIHDPKQPGTFTYYVSQTINSCESSRTQVQVVVNAQPAAPTVASQNLSGCQDALIQPLTATGTALQWYDASDNPIAAPTPVTRVDAAQQYIYKVAQTVNGCTSLKTSVTYTVNITPLPTVVSPAGFCQNGPTKLLQATGTQLKWYDPTGAVTTTPPSPPTSGVTAGTSYFVTQTSSLGCESRKAEIKVVVNALPTATLAGSTAVSLGNPAVLTLTLTGTGPYSYTLSDGTTGTTGIAVTSEATTVQPVSVTPATTTTYTVTRIANACGNGTTSGTATVLVRVPTVTTLVLASSTVCTGAPITVSFATTGEFAVGTAFTVEIAGATGDSTTRRYIPISNGVVQGPSIVTVIPRTVAQGQYYVRVTATNASFPIAGTRSPTLLTVKGSPIVTLSASKTSIYRGEKVQLLFTLTGDAPWTVNYKAGSQPGSFSSMTNPYSFTVAPDSTTTYKLLSVSNSCGLGTIQGADSTTIRVSVVTAEDKSFSKRVNVYPIPAESSVTVDLDFPLQNEPAQLQLINLNGQPTRQQTTWQRQTILNLEREPAGTYLLSIKIGNQSMVRKIIKR